MACPYLYDLWGKTVSETSYFVQKEILIPKMKSLVLYHNRVIQRDFVAKNRFMFCHNSFSTNEITGIVL